MTDLDALLAAFDAWAAPRRIIVSQREALDLARDRLIMGHRLYGDAWKQRTVDELRAEAKEERADDLAWSFLADMRERMPIEFCGRLL